MLVLTLFVARAHGWLSTKIPRFFPVELLSASEYYYKRLPLPDADVVFVHVEFHKVPVGSFLSLRPEWWPCSQVYQLSPTHFVPSTNLMSNFSASSRSLMLHRVCSITLPYWLQVDHHLLIVIP